VKNGGIVGRGILLDYHDWATRNNITYDPLSRHAIPLSALKAIVAEQNITIKAADILFIRTGFTAAYAALSPEEEPLVSQRKPTPEFVGVEATEEVLRWIWESDFSAVAGDSTSFELAPSTNPHSDPRFRLHHWLLAGWGMPIGELFNLEDLAKTCKELGRMSFFVSSVPLRVCMDRRDLFLELQLTDGQVPGGVASPPNAVAIF
jgi:kynurenine formamidase